MEEFTRTYSVIHTDALLANVEEVKKRVGDGVKLLAVVKANAYGHGAVRVAEELSDRVYGFAVATVREAMELRNAGITNMILILGYVCKAEYETMIRNDITFALLTRQMAEDINDTAMVLGHKALCHIKINTGMNRIGFPVCDETIEDIEYITGLKGLDCEGIFMHFATADETDKTFARQQYSDFMQVIKSLEERGISFAIRHCANSATCIDMPEYALDMVRMGIVLYGLTPSDEVDPNMKYHPVLELKSHIIFVKDVPAGEGISYGRTFITPEAMRIATVAVGYADGYPRSLSGKGEVLIRGRRAKILGRICMDQMMVDVSDIPDASVEDVVTLIGRDGDDEISVEELAGISGKFDYEFVCGISERVERKYV